MADSNKCEGCHKTLHDGQHLRCGRCPAAYCLECANVVDAGRYVTAAWVCVLCKSKQPKGDNSNTPVRRQEENAGPATGILSGLNEAQTSSSLTTLGSAADINASYVTTRRPPRHLDLSAVLATDASLTEDTMHMDSIRVAVRDELERVFNERMAAKIEDIVSKHMALAVNDIVSRVNANVSVIEKRLESIEVSLSTVAAPGVSPTFPADIVAGGKKQGKRKEKSAKQTAKSPGNNSGTKSSKQNHSSIEVVTSQDLPSRHSTHNATASSSTKPASASEKGDNVPVISERVNQHVLNGNKEELKRRKSSGAAEKKNEGVQAKDAAVADVQEPIVVNNTEAPKDTSPGRSRSSLTGVMRGTAAVGSTTLQAAERRHYLHLYYVKEGTTEEQVRQHLSDINNSDICGVTALKARGNYASFKLSVPPNLVENVMASDNWPKDVCIKPWLQNFRAKS
ncbi:uncharacterized protein LOC134743955 [Cydia strobilella]|uniref:uncharacterized protein LOC134743955 n=1 Tax=Cydia strobilella TaxID=1100964 RepID=UPI003005519A